MKLEGIYNIFEITRTKGKESKRWYSATPGPLYEQSLESLAKRIIYGNFFGSPPKKDPKQCLAFDFRLPYHSLMVADANAKMEITKPLSEEEQEAFQTVFQKMLRAYCREQKKYQK